MSSNIRKFYGSRAGIHKSHHSRNRNALHAPSPIPDVPVDDIDILFICYDNICNAVGNLCRAVNEHTKYKARYATACRNYLKCDMDLDLFAKARDVPIIYALMKKCNALQWVDLVKAKRNWLCSLYGIDSSPYVDAKINSYWFHGSILRQQYPVGRDHAKLFVSTPDLLYYAPHGMYLPNIAYMPDVPVSSPARKEIIQCLTVTGTIGDYKKTITDLGVYPAYPDAMDIKSSLLFRQIMPNVARSVDLNWSVIQNISTPDCIRRKASTSMLFDQMWLGSYGMNAIEAMYLGKPVVARLDAYSRKWYEAWAGEPCPVLQIELPTAEQDMLRHVKADHDPAYFKSWAGKAHDPRTVARVYVEKVLEGEK